MIHKRFILKLRLMRGKCTECSCQIPDNDFSDSIKGSALVCKSCRSDGYYEGRCPICNDGKKKTIVLRDYGFNEVQNMCDDCFIFLINDYRIQLQFGAESIIEKRTLRCQMCGYFVFRDNAQCPACKEKQKKYERLFKKPS